LISRDIERGKREAMSTHTIDANVLIEEMSIAGYDAVYALLRSTPRNKVAACGFV